MPCSRLQTSYSASVLQRMGTDKCIALLIFLLIGGVIALVVLQSVDGGKNPVTEANDEAVSVSTRRRLM